MGSTMTGYQSKKAAAKMKLYNVPRRSQIVLKDGTELHFHHINGAYSAENRKIIPNATPSTQLLKAVSEMGELADATIKGDKEGIEDAVGDVMVCLVNYCALQDLNLVDCMQVAYDQIKHRTGTLLPNGVFVKD